MGNIFRESSVEYPLKPYEFSSHTLVSRMIKGIGNQILDVGCGPGVIGEMIDIQENSLIGVDRVEPRQGRERFREFVVYDLECGLPVAELAGRHFDYILLLDILEHLVNPTLALQDVHRIADPKTAIVISVPNVANIYVRLSLLVGRFEYADRGILDRTHVRFFTRSSLKQWVRENGFVIEKQLYTNIPINEVFGKPSSNLVLKMANQVLYFFTSLLSGLLAYQIILVVRSNVRKSEVVAP